jgi:hypothetical protein
VAAGRIPARIRPPRLSEHRTEDDNLSRGHVLLDGAVRPAAVDDLPEDPVDLLANGTGSRRPQRRPAVQRQHELVALADRRIDESPQRFGRRRSAALGGLGVGQHLLERGVGEVVKQVFAAGEVPIESSDADSRVGRDCGHGHPRALPVHGRGRGPDEGLVVTGRVAARFA